MIKDSKGSKDQRIKDSKDSKGSKIPKDQRFERMMQEKYEKKFSTVFLSGVSNTVDHTQKHIKNCLGFFVETMAIFSK